MSISTATLGHRHLGQIDGLRPPEGQGGRVRISAGTSAASTPAGQHTLWMLTNLLARQFGVIAEIEIAVPSVALLEQVAYFGQRRSLAETLAEVVTLVAGAAITPVGPRPDAEPDAEVVVGPAHAAASSRDHFTIGVLGAGWRVFAGSPLAVPAPADRDDDDNPLGSYFAACLAAGEVFKRLCGLQAGKGRFIDSLALSLWDFREHDSWAAATSGPTSGPIAVPPAYLIGAGAVGQAALAALAAWPALRGHLTVIDREAVDATNLNRYPLATLAEVDADKAHMVRGRITGRGFSLHTSGRGWPGYALDSVARAGQRPELRHEEDSYRYRLVLSCVDKNVARHDIQNYWPEYLIGASTNGLGLAVTAYDMRSDYECLKCHNPPEPRGPSVEEIAEELRRLSPSARRQHAEERGADWHAIEQYLADPGCGRLGERELEKFASSSSDWSVGFVSVASGTLLAAQLVKYALAGRGAFPPAEGNTLRFSFLNPRPFRSMHRRSPECDCRPKGKGLYDKLWGDHK